MIRVEKSPEAPKSSDRDLVFGSAMQERCDRLGTAARAPL